MKDKKIGEWCIFVCLLLLLISRLFLNDEHSRWIQFIGFAGVIIALGDLYRILYEQNHKKDKFKVVTGLAIVVATLLMIMVVGMLLDFVVLDSKGNDILTILALLISLPNNLYCDWITKYVNN